MAQLTKPGGGGDGLNPADVIGGLRLGVLTSRGFVCEEWGRWDSASMLSYFDDESQSNGGWSMIHTS